MKLKHQAKTAAKVNATSRAPITTIPDMSIGIEPWEFDGEVPLGVIFDTPIGGLINTHFVNPIGDDQEIVNDIYDQLVAAVGPGKVPTNTTSWHLVGAALAFAWAALAYQYERAEAEA